MDEIKNQALDKVKQTPIQLPDADLMQLADMIVKVVEKGKEQLAISINQTIGMWVDISWNLSSKGIQGQSVGQVYFNPSGKSRTWL